MLSSLSVAVADALMSRRRPVITAYDLFRIVWDVYANPEAYPVKIRKRVSSPGYEQYKRVISELSSEKILKSDSDFGGLYAWPDVHNELFRVSDIADESAEEILCDIDPFCYISHLSAMQRYGISNRQPKDLMLTSPQRSKWKELANKKMHEDYEFDPREMDLKYFIKLHEIGLPEFVRNRNVHIKRSSKAYEIIDVQDTNARIIKIGDLFVETIDDAPLCGGIHHVMEVWEENADDYLEQIIQSVELSSSSIVKVRAGYILDEIMGIEDKRIESWVINAQRGGSRKLDSSKEYVSKFSEKWMISINV